MENINTRNAPGGIKSYPSILLKVFKNVIQCNNVINS